MSVSGQHVSKRLRTEALAIIDRKLGAMALWARKGIPVREAQEKPLQLEWFPTSLRSFCAWDGSQNDAELRPQLGELRRNAYQTLVSDDVRLQKVKALLSALKRQAVVARKKLNPRRAVQDAEEKIRIEREKRAGALLGYRLARTESRRNKELLTNEQRAHGQTIEKLRGQLEDQEKELGNLRKQVADLTATLRKTVPIRSIR